MSFDNEDDVFGSSGSQYLSAPRSSSRRPSGKQGMKGRKSSASLRGGSSLAQALDDDAGHGKHSLAHELAFALMPEPSAGSKMLQEEFGIEYDEGAEGIDEASTVVDGTGETLAMELNGHAIDIDDTLMPGSPSLDEKPLDDLDTQFGPTASPVESEVKPQSPQDPMDILSKDLESTDKFLSQLRQLDTDAGPSSAQLTIEKIASDMIRHINDSVRDREAQVRELVEVDREFRKMAGEMNGNDILGQLESLEVVDGLLDRSAHTDNSRHTEKGLDTLREETRERLRDISNDWETNPDDHHQYGDEDALFESEPLSPSPVKDSFPQPPPLSGPPTVLKVLPQVVHVRALTASLATSLTAISEHAQVNGAANADAGRKIRALKNKLGGWKSEWESAERSRIKIERWEAGLPDDDTSSVLSSPPRSGSARRIDGRRIVEEHLRAFENALAEANRKTQAIMARS